MASTENQELADNFWRKQILLLIIAPAVVQQKLSRARRQHLPLVAKPENAFLFCSYAQ